MPQPRRRSGQPRTARKPQYVDDGRWFEIRRILERRERKGRPEYLVEWEKDKRTGECCDATWARREDITAEALKEWENRDAQGPRNVGSQDTSKSKDGSQDSQPPRPSNWRSLLRQSTAAKSRAHSEIINENEDQEVEERPRKRQRYISEDSDPSASSPGCLTPAEDTHQRHAIAVVIPELKNFNPGDYMSIATSQSTIVGHSSQSISELESQGERIAVLANPAQRTTIPDSQDFEDSTQNIDSQGTSLATVKSFRSETNPEPIAQVSSSRQRYRFPSVVPDSAGGSTYSHIPSHQPHHYTIEASTTRNIPLEISTLNKHDSQDSSVSHSIPQPPSWQSQGSGPVFLTQPSYRIRAPSSSQSRTLSAGPETQLQLDNAAAQLAQASQSSRISQAAQVVLGTSLEPFTMDNTQERPEGQEHSRPRGDLSASRDMIDLITPFDHHTDHHAGPEQTGAGQILDLLENRPPTSHYDSAIERPGSQGIASEQGPRDVASQQRSPEPSPWTPSAMASNSDQFLTQPREPPVERVGPDFDDVWNQPPQTLNPEVQPAPHTISPAAISMPAQIEGTTLTLLPSFSEREAEAASSGIHVPKSSGESITMAQVPVTPVGNDASSPEPELDEDEVQDFYTVTLPMAARSRDVYENFVTENRDPITEFCTDYVNATGAAPGDEVQRPSKAVTRLCRSILQVLQLMCDFPHDLLGTPMEEVAPAADQVKYAVDANAKFNFLNELLGNLHRGDVLIVARPALLALLCRLVDHLELGCVCSRLSKNTTSSSDLVTVTIVPPKEEIDDISLYSVVIGYDFSFDDSGASKALENAVSSDTTPLILKLVTTHSIEHFRHLEPRKTNNIGDVSCLLFGIVKARPLVMDPPHGQLEPYEVAKIFYDYLNKDEDAIQWDPVPLPDECLHAMSGAVLSQLPAAQGPEGTPVQLEGRKRKLNDDGDDADSKRQRTGHYQEYEVAAPPLTDEVKDLLDKVGYTPGVENTAESHLSIPISVLELLAQQKSELMRQVEANNVEAEYQKVIELLEKQNRDLERSYNIFYQKFRTAVSDRTQFEKQAKKAEATADAKVQAALKANEKLEQKLTMLEAQVTRLTQDSVDGTLGATEKLLQEREQEVRTLKKRLETAKDNESYIQERYKEGTAAVTSINAENSRLKAENERLQEAASENRLRIHEIQNDNTSKELIKENRFQRSQIKDLETELDRVREELRQARNGRRETRQASVPRSPRMGFMSPRGGGSRSGLGTGSVSRGASPGPVPGVFSVDPVPGVPGMQFTSQQAGNARWGNGL